jgi:hypothetical protein
MDRWRVVQSSNVYGYYDETAITPQRGGIVYVTFLGWRRVGSQRFGGDLGVL